MNDRIAVLLTCHNRIDVTLRCLQKLTVIKPDAEVYCVDDASTDGTPDAIATQYPSIHLINGDGNLFWCRGMNLAWKTARKDANYDFYIWLNDDMMLYDNAFDELMECSKLNNNEAIISGIVQGRESRKAVYGGYDDKKKIISPNGEMQSIYNLNGNFVIIPKAVFNKLGFFDDVYHHDIGDVDYGLMARENGIKVLSTRCFIGDTLEKLKSGGIRIRKDGVGIIARFKKLYSPLGCNPFIDFHFVNKHRGFLLASLDFVYLHFINLIPDGMFDLLFPKYKH